MSECPICGLKNAFGAVKCRLCDSPLGKNAVAAGPEPVRIEPAMRNPASRSMVPIVMMISVLIALGGGVASFLLMRSSPDPSDYRVTEAAVPSVPESPVPLVPEPTPSPSPQAGPVPAEQPLLEVSPAATPNAEVDYHVINRIIRRHQAGLQACYEKQLRLNPEVKGVVGLEITISPEGSTSKVEFSEEDVGSPFLLTCLKDLVLTWRFPAWSGGEPVRVKFPVHFANPH